MVPALYNYLCYPMYSIRPIMQGGMKKNWMAYPRAVINRLPAKSILLFIQNQRGGTVSPHPTIPITRPRTAATPPNTSVNGDGFSKRYRPPRINVIGLINWNIQRNMAMFQFFFSINSCNVSSFFSNRLSLSFTSSLLSAARASTKIELIRDIPMIPPPISSRQK